MPCTLGEERIRGDNAYLMVMDGDWTYIPGQTDYSVPLAQGADGVTTKSDAGWEKNLPGNTSGSFTINCVYIWDDADVYSVFTDAMNNKILLALMEVLENPDGTIRIRRGCFVPTSYEQSAANGGHLTVSIGGTLSGPFNEDDLPD